MKDIKIITLGISISTIIFLLDMLIGFSAAPIFYILVLYLAFFFSSKEAIFAFMLLSILLIFMSMVHSFEDFNLKIISLVMVIFSGLISLMQRSSMDKLKALNDSLELKVLARTSSSTAKVLFLENQIKILQAIRSSDTLDSVKNLDNVISELKKIQDMEIYG